MIIHMLIDNIHLDCRMSVPHFSVDWNCIASLGGILTFNCKWL